MVVINHVEEQVIVLLVVNRIVLDVDINVLDLEVVLQTVAEQHIVVLYFVAVEIGVIGDVIMVVIVLVVEIAIKIVHLVIVKEDVKLLPVIMVHAHLPVLRDAGNILKLNKILTFR